MKESRNSTLRASGESQNYWALGSSPVKCESEKFLCDLRLSNAANPFLCGYYPSGTYRRMVWSGSGGLWRLALKVLGETKRTYGGLNSLQNNRLEACGLAQEPS